MNYVINGKKYLLVKNYRDALNEEELLEKLTDYFEKFDYVLGDYAYGKLRLKGFNNKNNEGYKTINDYANVSEYISKYCAYGCRYFILQKMIEKK